MKKLITILFLVSVAQAQPFASFNFTSKGFGIGAGYLESNYGFELTAGHNRSYQSTEVPNLTYLTIGRHTELGNDVSITPFAGVSDYRKKDFSQYHLTPQAVITDVKKILPIAGVELGKEISIARVFVSATYCDKMFYGIGIRGFLR